MGLCKKVQLASSQHSAWHIQMMGLWDLTMPMPIAKVHIWVRQENPYPRRVSGEGMLEGILQRYASGIPV